MLTHAPFRYALATNSTSAAFSAQNSTATEPSGAGVIDLMGSDFGIGVSDHIVPSHVQLIPFGTDADNKTFDMRLYGYSATVPNSSLVTTAAIYIPQLLLDLSLVLCARTFSNHAASTFLVDTITVNKGAADNAEWRSVISTANDTVASIVVGTRGCRYLKFDWSLSGNTAVSMNCLIRAFEF